MSCSWNYENTLMVAESARTKEELRVALMGAISLIKRQEKELRPLRPLGEAVPRIIREEVKDV